MNNRSALLLLTLLVLMLKTAVSSSQAQAGSGITEPAASSQIAGVVTIIGTAAHPDYLRYELSFRNVSDAAADWVVFAEGSQPVTNGTLAIWDTTVGRDVGVPVFPDGRYQLRLRVVRTDYNYDEYFVSDLVVANNQPTAIPTPEKAETRPAAVATLGATAVYQPAQPLPSLTPFATATPLPGPAVTPSPASETLNGTDETGGGLFGQVAAVDTNRFARAFWLGVGLVAFLFGLLALYLLLRAIFRRVWRWYWARKN